MEKRFTIICVIVNSKELEGKRSLLANVGDGVLCYFHTSEAKEVESFIESFFKPNNNDFYYLNLSGVEIEVNNAKEADCEWFYKVIGSTEEVSKEEESVISAIKATIDKRFRVIYEECKDSNPGIELKAYEDMSYIEKNFPLLGGNIKEVRVE